MRLTYNKDIVIQDKKGKFKFEKNSSNVNAYDFTSNYLMKYEVKTYNDFLEKIKNEKKTKIEKTYYTFKLDWALFIMTKDLNFNELKPLVYYRYENSDIKDVLETVLSVRPEKFSIHHVDYINGKAVVASSENKFNFLTAPQVLNVIFTYKNIVARGELPFTRFKIKGKSGKIRDIVAPHPELKASLRELNHLLQCVYDHYNADFQVAYKKGKNVKSNAEIHINHKYVFNIDLHNFFPSCKKDLVRKYIGFLFINCPNRRYLEELFLDMITLDGGLFVGSPISGCLANTIINKPVKYLSNICKKYDIGFSVYADDMTFSSNKFLDKDFVLGLFNLAFHQYGLDEYFVLNEEKCHAFTNNRKITGVSISEAGFISCSRKMYRDIRVKIDYLEKGDKTIDVRKLRGQIAYATMLDTSGKMFRYLTKKYNTVKQYNLCSDEKLEELKNR